MTIEEFNQHGIEITDNAERDLNHFRHKMYSEPIDALKWPAEALRAAATLEVWDSIFVNKKPAKFDYEGLKKLARKYAMQGIEPTSSRAHDEFEEYRRRAWARVYELLESVK